MGEDISQALSGSRSRGLLFFTRKHRWGFVTTLAVVTLLVPATGTAQSFDTLRIATYNILNYPGGTSAARNAEFRKVIHTLAPDVLVVQELISAAGQAEFLTSVLNASTPNLYAAPPFHDGPDTDNGLFYKPTKCEFLGATYLATPLRDIAEYVLRPVNSTTQLRIYSVHLKANTGATNEQARLQEAMILRSRLDSLPSGTPFLILGDFNIYSSSEPAFQLLTSTGTNAAGQAFDPPNLSGSWGSNPAFAPYHTQSPRVRSFGGGSTGGMDDRFDMILTSSTMAGRLVPSSYIAYGNDGNHFNDSINRWPNAAVPDSVANALHAASDHIPVAAKFVFERNVVPIQLAYFNGSLNASADSIVLRWGTVSETNNFGFYVQKRSTTIEPWWTIEHSFIPGHGTTLEPQHYRFAEPKVFPATTVFYRLQQLDLDGTAHFTEGIAVSAVSSVTMTQPTTVFLSQNYPNPFNAQTVIEFRVASSDVVSLTVYDLLGREVRRLFEGEVAGGTTYSVRFDASDVAGSVYFYRFVSAQHGTATRRLVYLK